MISGFKKLLAGVLSFFVGLFAGKKAQADKPNLPPASAKPKKRSGYFMELDESEDIKSGNGSPVKKAEPVAATKQAVEATKNATVAATKQVAETVKTSAPVAAAKQAVEKTKSPEPAAKTNTKTAEPAAKKSKVELVQTAEGLKAEPAKPSPSVASSNGQSKTETTFAPKYLNPVASSNSRRRPGANMSNFLDMANQVKNQAKGS